MVWILGVGMGGMILTILVALLNFIGMDTAYGISSDASNSN